ncbi:Aspartyl/glutamyl-tRNA(Asn/Gln) amidotransferase subunit B, partial [Bienertia sinuspersici]
MSGKERSSWTNKAIETFLDLCLESKNSGLTRYDWEIITLRLNAQIGKNLERKAVETTIVIVEKRFKAWHELKTKWTGIGWNEITGCPMIDPNDEKWKAFVKLYKGKPSAFLKRPLPFEQKMHELFAGTFATGGMAWASNSSGPSFFDKGKVVEVEEGSGDSEDGQFQPTKGDEGDPLASAASKSPSNTLSGKKRKNMDGGQISSKRSVIKDLDTCMDVLRKNIQIGTSKAQSSPQLALHE